MKTLTLQIDGRTVTADEGMSLLDAARRAGIEIPTLCHNDQLKPSGACRMCLVEIVKGKRRKLVASCVYPAEEGLVVTTENDQIRKFRKLIIELLWPSWSCLGEKYGVSGSRFAPGPTDCSLCGLCVHYCQEVAHKNVAYFKGRGINRRLALVPGMENECASCRQCHGLCTGGRVVTQANLIESN